MRKIIISEKQLKVLSESIGKGSVSTLNENFVSPLTKKSYFRDKNGFRSSERPDHNGVDFSKPGEVASTGFFSGAWGKIKDLLGIDSDEDKEILSQSLMLWDGMSKGREEKRGEVEEMQKDLLDRGYYFKYNDDGKFGEHTLGAVNAFQSDHGFKEMEVVTPEVLGFMKDEGRINKNPDRNEPEVVKREYKKGDAKPFSNVVKDAIIQASDKYDNVSKELLFTIASIESGGNPAAENPRSKAAGLFQILPRYQSEYGVNSKSVWDPYKSSNAAARKLNRKIKRLRKFLGREPKIYEIYLTHNQGTTGFKIIRTACDDFGYMGGEDSLRAAAKRRGRSRKYGSHVYDNMKGNKGGTPCKFLKTWEGIVGNHKSKISAML